MRKQLGQIDVASVLLALLSLGQVFGLESCAIPGITG
jgi:hypothetical protein